MNNVIINGIKTLVKNVNQKFADVLKNSYYEVQSNASRSSHQGLFLRKQSLTTGL